MKQLRTSILLICAFLGSPTDAPSSELTIEVGREIRISGATPNSEVALVSASKELNGYVRFLRSYRKVHLADEEGVYILPTPYPAESIATWAAIDVVTGDIVSATADNESSIRVPQEVLVEDTRSFNVNGRRVQVLGVRPGLGAWFAAIADGSGTEDTDREQNGSVGVGGDAMLDRFNRSMGSLRNNDLFVVIEQESLEVEFYVVAFAEPSSPDAEKENRQ